MAAFGAAELTVLQVSKCISAGGMGLRDHCQERIGRMLNKGMTKQQQEQHCLEHQGAAGRGKGKWILQACSFILTSTHAPP